MKHFYSTQIIRFYLTAIVILIAGVIRVQAQTFYSDATFGSSACGRTDETQGTIPRQVFPLADGSIITVMGYSNNENGDAVVITKLNASGAVVWTTGRYNGGFTNLDPLNADYYNGKIFVCGYKSDDAANSNMNAWVGSFDASTGANQWQVTVPSTDGVSDIGFTTAIAMHDGSGSVVVFGSQQPNVYQVGSDYGWLQKYKSDGTLDNTYNTGSPSIAPGGYSFSSIKNDLGIYVSSLVQVPGVLQSTGKIVIAVPGTSNPSVIGEINLIRFNTDGTVDNSFAGSGNYYNTFWKISGGNTYKLTFCPYDMKLAVGDKLRIAAFQRTQGQTLLQFDSDGNPDNSFGPSHSAITSINSSAIYPVGVELVIDTTNDNSYYLERNLNFPTLLSAYRIFPTGSVDNPTSFTILPTGTGFNGDINLKFASCLFNSHRIGVATNSNTIGVSNYECDVANTLTINSSYTSPNTTMSVTTANTSCFSFQWYKDGSAIGGANGSSYTTAVPGTYYVIGNSGNDNQSNSIVVSADYRSKQDGSLSNISTWEIFDGINWVDATQIPGSTNNVDIKNNVLFDEAFTIGAGKTLTVESSGIANFNNQAITVQSTADGTGAIGTVLGSITNAGNVTVERYIPANDGTRAWRLLSVPTGGSQTINAAWQEGQTNSTDNVPEYGTIITAGQSNNGWAAKGFDAQQTNGSILTYNASGNNWVEVPNTNSKALATTSGYFLYVRGNRSIVPSGSSTGTSSTTLRSTGSLYVGDVSTSNIASGNFALIGNIYASPIDFTQLSNKTNLDNAFYVWDPKLLLGGSLGHYQLFSGSTTTPWTPLYPGGSYNSIPNSRIETGEAFFVHATGGTGSLTMNESSKLAGTVDVFRPQAPSTVSSQLTTNLYEANTLADVAVSVFNNNYSNAVDVNDAVKLSNTGINMGISRDGKTLSIESRQPVSVTDTIYFNLWNLTQQSYKLEFVPNNFNAAGLTAYLQDNYLNTSTAIDLSSKASISFTVDANAASSAANRFRLVFANNSPVPVIYSSVKASQQNSVINVEWKVGNETNITSYEVESSTDGVHFTNAASVKATNIGSYNWTDAHAANGDNYYRIRSISSNGSIQYSVIVKVNTATQASSVKVYPSLLTGHNVTLQLTNQPKGSYHVRLLNSDGQLLFKGQLSHGGGSSSQSLNLPAGLAHGMYKLEVISPLKLCYVQKILIE